MNDYFKVYTIYVCPKCRTNLSGCYGLVKCDKCNEIGVSVELVEYSLFKELRNELMRGA